MLKNREEEEEMDETEDLIRSYCQELRMEERKNRKLERENEQFRKTASELASSVARKSQTIAVMEGKMVKYRDKIQLLSTENGDLVAKLKEMQETCKFLEFDLNTALRKIEGLEEDMKFLLSSTPMVSESPQAHNRHISFLPFLPGIEESETEDGSVTRRGLSSDLGWDTQEEVVFSLHKERNTRREVSGSGVEKGLLSVLRGKTVWGVVRVVWVLLFRYVRRRR